MSQHDMDPRIDDLLGPPDSTDDDVSAEALDAMFSNTMRDVADAEKRPTFYLKTRSTRVRRAAAFAAFAVIGGVTAATMLREDFFAYPAWRMALGLASVGILLLASIFTALRPSHLPTLPRWKSVGLVVVSCFSVFVLAGLPMAEQAAQHGEPLEGVSLFAHAMPCLYFGLLLGVPVYVLVRLLDRGSRLSAFLAAAAAGLVGNFVLQLHCPIDDPLHDVAAHAGVVVLFLVIVAGIEWVGGMIRKKKQ